MENTVEKEDKKQTRRELLDEWKEKRENQKSHPHPASSSKKPLKFEEILRNDAVTFESLRKEAEPYEKKRVSMVKKRTQDIDQPIASSSSQRQNLNPGQDPEIHQELKETSEANPLNSQQDKIESGDDTHRAAAEPENETKEDAKSEETTNKDEKKPLVSCLKSSNSKSQSKLRKTATQKIFEEKDEMDKGASKKKATSSKKRKTLNENDQLLNERGELKKVHITQDMELQGEKEKITFDSSKVSSSQPKKNKSEDESESFAEISKHYGSGMRYSIKEIKTGKSGSKERVITPVRTSRRISSNRSKSPSDHQKKLVSGVRSIATPPEEQTNSKLSVTFMEDSEDIRYVHNDIEDIFRPIDDETSKIKEMIRKRRPTPYSKSQKKPDEETDDEEDRSLNHSFKSGGDNSHSKLSKEDGIEFEKVIDPDIRGNGNYALVEIKASSAKKFGAKRAITPLKDITKEKLNEAAEDVKFITKGQEVDIGYIPRNSEIAKKLESLF